MAERIKWIDRRFDFSFPVDLYPEMLERLRGTPARLEDRLAGVPPQVLTQRHGDRWSIQENAGHLLDLEPLVSQRLDEYVAGADVLHAADMSNRKTYQAEHNQVQINSILSLFRLERTEILRRLDSFPPEMFGRRAHHPRLNVSMRLVDMVFFQSEHDDFHLARISELLRLFS